MTVMIVVSTCIGCNELISYNPEKVPSLRIEGVRHPLCKNCFNRWNKIHRTDKGLEPVYLHPDAYSGTKVE